MNIDIWYQIFDFLDFKSQILFKNVCHEFSKFEITNMYNVKTSKITQTILNKCDKLIRLDLYDNIKQLRVNHLHKLRFLKISGACNVDDIMELENLIFLDMSNNFHIKDLPKNIKFLDISGFCNLDKNKIDQLQLKKTNTFKNNKYENSHVFNSISQYFVAT